MSRSSFGLSEDLKKKKKKKKKKKRLRTFMAFMSSLGNSKYLKKEVMDIFGIYSIMAFLKNPSLNDSLFQPEKKSDYEQL
jgi:hypothetical protein